MSLSERHVSAEKGTINLQQVMIRCMRCLQARQTLGGNHGIEALEFRAEVQRAVEVTIHTKNSRIRDGGITGVAVDVALFTGVSADQKPHKRASTYWIVVSLSLILIRDA